MSEPPPSSTLVSLARSLSGISIDFTNGGPLAAPEQRDSPPPVTGIELGPGLYFADGKRKVDYVLSYKCKKRRASKSRLSIASNGSMPFPVPGLRFDDGESGECPTTTDTEEQKLTDEEKVLMREEFEAQLVVAGLQLERDKERANGIRFLRLHVPWPILSREAELQKIKVAVTKKCELRKRTGIAGIWDHAMVKLTTPFQPDVPDLEIQRDPQTRVRFKTLKHAFLRDKLHLYDIKSTETLFDNATRSRIVAEIISRITCTQTCQTTGIQSLLARGVYESAFPLHDGSFTRRGRRDQRNDRQILHEEWANYGVMHKYQPVDLIRKYFGEQIGLYFAWLGVYTQLLIPPSVLGVIVFIYGIFTVDSNIPSQETCDERLNITMCPLCDGVCDYWQLSSVCSLARASYLFDNGATVLFAIFMSLWAACFLEHWKRRQMYLKHAWDLTSMQDEEERVQEELRPEYESALQEKRENMKAQTKKKVKSEEETDGEMDQILCSQHEVESLDIEDHLCGYLINVSTFIFLMVVSMSAVVGVAVYRICMLSVWSMNPDPEAKASVRMTVTTTGIVLNMLVVLVLEEVYGAIAVWLTELEIPRTKEEFEERLIFKSFFLKSMNAFAPIFYVAFFKGRFAGRPGDYVYAFGDYRMEECAPPGCLIELCIQLSMIMLGKQLIQNNVFEILIPKLKKMYRSFQEQKGQRKAAEDEENEAEGKRPKQQYHKDYALEPFEGVTPEYMEMIIQFGFVSLFVASFPLAPAFALLNNVIEIRLDASKFVTEIRRPDAVRCKDIGIWYYILSGISKFAVITNAFVISFTSEFVPRMMYQFMYSENGTMAGYTEHSLAYFNVSNFALGSAPTSTLLSGVATCRYKDYRDPPWAPEAYTYSKHYWAMLAAKLAFVIFFQNLAMLLSLVVAWIIPDVPRSLRDQLKKENIMLMEFLVNHDKDARDRSPRRAPGSMPDIHIQAPDDQEEQSHQRNGLEEQDQQHHGLKEEEEEQLSFGNNYIHPSDSDPDIVKSFTQGAEEQKDLKEHTDEEGNQAQDPEESKEEKQEQESETEGARFKENPAVVDLDSLMTEFFMTDAVPSEPPHSSSQQLQSDPHHDDPHPADPHSESHPEPQREPQPPVTNTLSKFSSVHSLHPSGTLSDTSLKLIQPPPPAAKARCSTLPSSHRGAAARHSLPRPRQSSSHSSSLSRLQRTSTPLVPLIIPLVPLSSPPDPLSTPSVPLSTHSVPLSNSSDHLSTPQVPLSIPSVPLSTPADTLSTSSDPLSTSSVPLSTPSVPLSTPQVPLSTPSDPLSTSSDPLSVPSVPLSTPQVPLSTPSDPLSTSSDPLSTPSVPLSTPQVPLSIPSDPLSTSSDPLSTSSDHLSTPSDPLSTSSDPLSIPSVPLSTSSDPLSISSVPLSTPQVPFSTRLPPPPAAKARSSTLPSSQRGAAGTFQSLPRPRQSSSLSHLQQTSTPLFPLSLPPSDPLVPLSASLQTRGSTELLCLKGPPPHPSRSRGKGRCSTLPPRQRPPGPEEQRAGPTLSTSLSALGESHRRSET